MIEAPALPARVFQKAKLRRQEIEAVPMDVIPKEFFEKNSVGSMQACLQ